MKELKIGGCAQSIQTTALFRSVRILRRVIETCCHSDSSERSPVKTGVKYSQGIIII